MRPPGRPRTPLRGRLEWLARACLRQQARSRLRDVRIRAVECMAEAELRCGQASAAIRSAQLVLRLDDLPETAWQILMRAHTAAGNPAQAVRAYQRCRQTLQEQLDTAPSPRTRAAVAQLPGLAER
jgi:DNA-binding SARP family transcriptional activator